MPLQRGEILGYDFNRMVVDFTMPNQSKTVRCAISTAAMDDLEGKHDVKADQRVDQFVRLRDAIEERSSQEPQGRLAAAVAKLTRQSPEHPLMRRPALKLSSRAWRPPPGDGDDRYLATETIDFLVRTFARSRRYRRAARPAQEPRSDADVGPISPDYWRL